MKERKDIVEYYDSIASTYDSSRFGNSYGAFIDAQERKILSRFLAGEKGTTLEMACGTGRLLDFADCGVDASGEMLAQAAIKFPEKTLVQAAAHDLPFDAGSFNAVYCFHLIMHLDREYISDILNEVSRILRPGGCFIFDFPSAQRRKFSRRNQGGWHGNTELTLHDVRDLASNTFTIDKSCGIMFAPVHVLPKFLRGCARPLDSWICRTPMKNLASYIAVKLVKK